MSEAEEMRAAASKLRKRGAEATPGPWHRPLDVRNKAVVTAALPEGEEGRYLDGRPERVGVVQLNTWSDGKHMRKRGGRDLEWIALANPGLAAPLATWLESAAEDSEVIGTDHQALAVARAINGGES